MKLVTLKVGNQSMVTQGLKKTFHKCFSGWGKDKICQEISYCYRAA